MSLLAPAFLLGLLAIGLPMWLHRLSAENPNRKPFSSVMFLEEGEPQRVLAQKIQYWLLLAFRIAVIVALVFAFMQPACWRDPAAGAAGEQRLHVVVVDTSASMNADDHWDEAIDAANRIINQSPVGAPVQIIAAGRLLEVITGATLDKSEVRQSLQTLEPGSFHVDFGQLTRALDGILRTAELPVILHFVTDTQATGLPTRFADLAPAESVEIQIHAVTEQREPNWTVVALTGSAQTGELAATIASHAEASATKTLVLELNGTEVERQQLTLAPGEQLNVEFEPISELLEEGANRVRAILSPADELSGDDIRMLALNKPVPHPVLVVSGETDNDAEDARFLVDAMSVLEGLAFDVTTVFERDLTDHDFSDYEFVVVLDAAAIDSRADERLRDYVENGGGLLVAFGDRSGGVSAVPVTGTEFELSRSGFGNNNSGAAAVGDIQADHPALAGLASLRAVEYTQHVVIEPEDDDDVLIWLQSGEPLLIETEVGNGRMLIYTSSLDRIWNDLPREPAFVPLVAGVADYLLGGAGFSNEAALGSTLALQAMGMSGGQIYDPDGESVLGLGGAGTDVLLERIGFYELVGGGRSELVAVNFDVRESDLAPASAQTLQRWQALGQAAVAAEGGTSVLSERIQVPWGFWIIYILLVAAIVESAIGNWHLRVRRGIAA